MQISTTFNRYHGLHALVCRRDSAFRLYKRATDTEACLAATYSRNDLPSALQVSLCIYSTGGSPDINALDYVRFTEASDESCSE